MRGCNGAIAIAALSFLCSVAQADLILQLQATNFNPTTKVWADSSGKSNDALYTAGDPTLTTLGGVTAVHFPGSTYFTLENMLWQTSPGAGYTAIVVVRPDAAQSGSILGGVNGNFQYRIGGDGFAFQQQVIVRNIERLGHGNAALSTTPFSVMSVAVDGAGTSYFLNGAADGTAQGSTFNVPSATNRIGAAIQPNNTADEFFLGDIAEIRVYDTPLSSGEILTIQNELYALYVVPEPAGVSLLAVAAVGALANRWRRDRRSRYAESVQ